MTTRRRPKPEQKWDAEYDVHLAGPSTTCDCGACTIQSGKTPGGRRRHRRAASLGGAKIYGMACPVSVTLTLRGGGQWLEVRAPNGRFFTCPESSVRALMTQVIQGGHFVLEEASTTRRSGRGKAG